MKVFIDGCALPGGLWRMLRVTVKREHCVCRHGNTVVPEASGAVRSGLECGAAPPMYEMPQSVALLHARVDPNRHTRQK